MYQATTSQNPKTPNLGRKRKAMGGGVKSNPSLLANCDLVESHGGFCSNFFFSEVGVVDLGEMAKAG